MLPSLADIHAARQRIAGYVRRTPLLPLPPFSQNMPPHLRLKLENTQVSGSFKARGAFNNLLKLAPDVRARGVVTASGGNHGLALAYAARRLGIPAIIYLTETASADRVTRIADQGAEILRYGTNPSDALERAARHGEETGMTFVHPFDALGTLEGTGTLGLELLEDLPELDYVLLAIGGGGLIAGAATAIRLQRPGVRIVGVEPVGAPSMKEAVDAGAVVTLGQSATIADTLSPRAVSERTLLAAREYVDEIVLVDDAAMIRAMRWLWTECNQLVEPAGAAVVAALLEQRADVAGYASPAAVICGGNAAAGPVFASYEASAAALAATP